jgi:cytidylate kinase
MIITISGDIGSGKSTTGRLLAATLGYKYLSTGNIQRKIAEEMNLTTLELNLLSEKMTEIDDKIDAYTRALNEAPEDYVVDSRLAWHFIPDSYKVFLRCGDQVAASRIFKDSDRFSDEHVANEEILLERIKDRRQSEKRRFLEKYNVDFQNLEHYDFIIDSSYFTPGEIVDMIQKGIDFYLQKEVSI